MWIEVYKEIFVYLVWSFAFVVSGSVSVKMIDNLFGYIFDSLPPAEWLHIFKVFGLMWILLTLIVITVKVTNYDLVP